MISKQQILDIAERDGKISVAELSRRFSVSRQYVNRLIKELVGSERLIKVGATRYAFYVSPSYAKTHKEVYPVRFSRSFVNRSLEEHKVLHQIEQMFPLLKSLPENVKSIFTYAFSEMFNNAIEHSRSVRIRVEVSVQKNTLLFIVSDSGIGVFRNVMRKRGLKTELEAIQDIMKGKATTMPKSHSGEGIFFTSKAGDVFTLDSYGYQLIVNNEIPDVFVKKAKKLVRGTRVSFQIQAKSRRHLNQLFKQYTHAPDDSAHGFDKTRIQVKLYTHGGVNISRSQARRVLTGLEKFKTIVFDFDKVPVVGQAFADEVFRVFHIAHPHIKLEEVNMDEGVRFMVVRAKTEAAKA